MDLDQGPYCDFNAEEEEYPNDVTLHHQFKQRGFNYNGGYMDGKVLKYTHMHLSKDVYAKTVCNPSLNHVNVTIAII